MKTKNKKFCLNVGFLFKRLCCVAILCLLLFAPACSENKEDNPIEGISQIDWENVPFEISSGVNISCWISQTNVLGKDRPTIEKKQAAYFLKKDVRKLADMGFDHIRLPVDESELFSEDGSWNKEVRQYIHDAIAWCSEYNLRVILDFHILRSHYFNDTENMTLWKDVKEQDKFVAMWKKIVGEYGQYPIGLLAFELLNEPVSGDNPDNWNKLYMRVLTELRKSQPNRLIIIDSGDHASIKGLTSLEVPANDKNLMLTFHSYTPYLLTHYKASWLKLKDIEVDVNYPGQLIEQSALDKYADNRELYNVLRYYGMDKDINGQYTTFKVYNQEVLEEGLSVALQKSRETGLKLHCGEFGCIDGTEKDIQVAWFNDMVTIFKKYNIAFSVWGYKSNFGIFNENGTVKDQRIIDALTK